MSKFPWINSFPGSTEKKSLKRARQALFTEKMTWPQVHKVPEEHAAPLPMRNIHKGRGQGSHRQDPKKEIGGIVVQLN